MSERRVSIRQPSLVFYDLAYADTGQRFGDLVDLSHEGLMAWCDAPMLPGSRVALQLDIAARMLGTRSINFEAQCCWCRETSGPDGYACGLQVVKSNSPAAAQFPHLAATMLFDTLRAF